MLSSALPHHTRRRRVPCLLPRCPLLCRSSPPAHPTTSPFASLQAWAVLERDAGNTGLARELLKCAVKADPKSEPSWLVRARWRGSAGWAMVCRARGVCISSSAPLPCLAPSPTPPPPACVFYYFRRRGPRWRRTWASTSAPRSCAPSTCRCARARTPAGAGPRTLAAAIGHGSRPARDAGPWPNPTCIAALPWCARRHHHPQERVEIVKPANFASYAGGAGRGDARGGLLAPIFTQVRRVGNGWVPLGRPAQAGSRHVASLAIMPTAAPPWLLTSLPAHLHLLTLPPAPVRSPSGSRGTRRAAAPHTAAGTAAPSTCQTCCQRHWTSLAWRPRPCPPRHRRRRRRRCRRRRRAGVAAACQRSSTVPPQATTLADMYAIVSDPTPGRSSMY